MGVGILGVELKNTVFNPPKTALLQLFRPPSLFHSYVSEYSNSVSSANYFHEKIIYFSMKIIISFHENKYFLS